MSDDFDWLAERLTPARQAADNGRWRELAEVIQVFWETGFDDFMLRLERLRNVFESEEADIDRKLEELGAVFEFGLPMISSNKPLAISWRREEIHKKNTAFPIESVINREFNNMAVRWEPLIAYRDEPYGSRFFSMHDIGLLYRDAGNIEWGRFYLTSRGRLSVDLRHLRRIGVPRETFESMAANKIEPMTPLHIVYEGEYYLPDEFIIYLQGQLVFSGRTVTPTYTLGNGQSRPAGERFVLTQNERERHYRFVGRPQPEAGTMVRFDTVPLDVVPLDYYLEI